MALEPRETLFLNRDDDLIAAQQTGGAVVRSADAQNPGMVVHVEYLSTAYTDCFVNLFNLGIV